MLVVFPILAFSALFTSLFCTFLLPKNCKQNNILTLVTFVSGLYETCLFNEDDSSRLTVDGQSSYDEVHLHRLKNSLSGVPPPPLVTYPQQNVDEILHALRGMESSTEDEPDSPSDDLLLILRLFSQEKVEKILTFLKTLNKAKEGDGKGENKI